MCDCIDNIERDLRPEGQCIDATRKAFGAEGLRPVEAPAYLDETP